MKGIEEWLTVGGEIEKGTKMTTVTRFLEIPLDSRSSFHGWSNGVLEEIEGFLRNGSWSSNGLGHERWRGSKLRARRGDNGGSSRGEESERERMEREAGGGLNPMRQLAQSRGMRVSLHGMSENRCGGAWRRWRAPVEKTRPRSLDLSGQVD